MSIEKVQLTASQTEILTKIMSWLEPKLSSEKSQRRKYRNYVILGGYAGTGKTTLIAHLRKKLHTDHPRPLKVAFCSYTGKAVQILKTKLQELNTIYDQDICTTIHALIYESETDRAGNILNWKLKPTLNAELIVVDEGSMLTEKIWRDLKSFGKPILVVGDHGQLPPIGDNFNLLAKPDLQLTEIYRQAAENPIIHLSQLIRTKKIEAVAEIREALEAELDKQKLSESITLLDKTDPYEGGMVSEEMQASDLSQLVVCGFNYTRVRLNNYLRGLKFMDDYLDLEKPQPNDKVICLKNNHQAQIFNGMIGELAAVTDHTEKTYLIEVHFPDYNRKYRGVVAKEQFGAKKTIAHKDLKSISAELQKLTEPGEDAPDIDLFDYGYALTVHKAQGSQAEKVLVFAERFKQMEAEDWIRWLYTAVTRAEEKLVIIY